MKFSKENLSAVKLCVEFDMPEENSLNDDDITYIANYPDSWGKEIYIFDTGGTTEMFMANIKFHALQGCPQNVISYLKYARDVGAAWTIFKRTKNV